MVTGIFQFSAVEDVAVLEAIGIVAAEDVCIGTADAEVPRIAAEVVVDFGIVREDVAVVAGRAIISEVDVVRADPVGYGRTIVDLRIGTDTNAVIPRSIVAVAFAVVAVNSTAALVLEADTSITGQFNVADTVFESADANAEIIEFIGKFVSQFVDEGTLFDRSFVHVSHGFGDHFSGFITGNIALTLEVFAVDTLNDAASANSTTDL
mgnify:CR=1 FL=1